MADGTRAHVLNRPSSACSNESKPAQLLSLAALGFAVPHTVVTTDPVVAYDFAHAVGSIIVKSVSGERSIARKLDRPNRKELEKVANCPAMLQQYVAGRDVRVHVVGDVVFAHEIRCSAADYRYARRDGLPRVITRTELPPAIASRCLAVSRALDLRLTGIDLRRTHSGDWYALEANPSPAFGFYELNDPLGIPEAVAADLSVGGSSRAAPPADPDHRRTLRSVDSSCDDEASA